MVKKNYYAVKKGYKTGIFQTWEECRLQVIDYPDAKYKGFATRSEAEKYLNSGSSVSSVSTSKPVFAFQSAPPLSTGVKAYVDGSYDSATNTFSYGMVVLVDGAESKFCKKFYNLELASMHNVAGEIKGAEAAMQYALDHGIKNLIIYHDYEGIAKWCTGEWKANKPGTIAYRNFYIVVSKKVKINFIKVAGHSGDKYNDMADSLAKSALGLL